MKRTTALTIRVALPSRARAKRTRVLTPPPAPADAPPCEAMIFLEWLTASNLGSEHARTLK